MTHIREPCEDFLAAREELAGRQMVVHVVGQIASWDARVLRREVDRKDRVFEHDGLRFIT